jgi:hypothetical protein
MPDPMGRPSVRTREQEWYRQQLRKPEWKAKRRAIYHRDRRTCVRCGKSGIRIHCHHTYYLRGRKPWDYPANAFETLCDDCHVARHRQLIPKFGSPEEAEMWQLFLDADREVAQQIIDEELAKRAERIAVLEDAGAVWDSKGQFYSLTDDDGVSRTYDADGSEM